MAKELGQQLVILTIGGHRISQEWDLDNTLFLAIINDLAHFIHDGVRARCMSASVQMGLS